MFAAESVLLTSVGCVRFAITSEEDCEEREEEGVATNSLVKDVGVEIKAKDWSMVVRIKLRVG